VILVVEVSQEMKSAETLASNRQKWVAERQEKVFVRDTRTINASSMQNIQLFARKLAFRPAKDRLMSEMSELTCVALRALSKLGETR
jgi:hypothetical protein